MKITVLDRASVGADLDLSLFESFGELTVYDSTSPEQLAVHIADSEIVILNKIRITEQVLAVCPGLRMIAVTATGYDNIDLDACRAHGVAVTNVKGYSTHSVAQLTLAMVLSLACRLPEYTDYVTLGDYTASGIPNRLTPVYHELAGLTWGVVGYGDIGRQVAAVASAMGCRVIATRRTPTEEDMFRDIDTLCAESDIITLHTPLTPETERLIDSRRLGLMKPGVILVNMARGRVTDETAVAQAVLSGRLGGFGCDVYSTEPFSEKHPFTSIMHLPGVLLTPHMAWGAYEARVRCLREIAANIDAFIKGERRCRVD